MRLFNNRRRGVETDMHTGGQILPQPMAEPGEPDRFTSRGLHDLYFTTEASALRTSLDSVATRTDAHTARDI